MNITWSQRIFEELHSEGVRDVVFCAGARNSPMVAVLAQTSGFELCSFFEERSAAFYALGVARRTGRPVAVVTTSGTAAAELLPATIEAFHTGIPLILVTADRPKRLRGTGAPQAIDQTGLFAKFVELEFDLEEGAMFSLAKWNRRAPIHLNVCFDEPLLDKPVESFDLSGGAVEPSSEISFKGRSVFSVTAGADWAALRLTRFLRSTQAQAVDADKEPGVSGVSESDGVGVGLGAGVGGKARVEGLIAVVVGTLETDVERDAVAEFLVKLRAPAYLEATSGLRERPELQEFALRSGDKVLSWALKHNLIDRVLRIGGIPTVRIWRDLDEKTSTVQVFSLTPLPFSGLSRGEMICAEIAPALAEVSFAPGPMSATLLAKDREAEAELNRLFALEPEAEPSLVNALSRLIPEGANLYVGNSLPIREWDLAASYGRKFTVEANRGVNGIDGQLSTFIGLAEDKRENWMVLGDLTAMYDLAGPWAFAYRSDAPMRIAIINNGGGKIFTRIFRNALFENRHDIGFEDWARMWKLGYAKWTTAPDSFSPSRSVEIIEVVPDEAATRRFWDRYDNLWS